MTVKWNIYKEYKGKLKKCILKVSPLNCMLHEYNLAFIMYWSK